MEVKRELLEQLVDALATALPFVEDAENDPAFKRGYVKRTAEHIRELVLKGEAALKEAQS